MSDQINFESESHKFVFETLRDRNVSGDLEAMLAIAIEKGWSWFNLHQLIEFWLREGEAAGWDEKILYWRIITVGPGFSPSSRWPKPRAPQSSEHKPRSGSVMLNAMKKWRRESERDIKAAQKEIDALEAQFGKAADIVTIDELNEMGLDDFYIKRFIKNRRSYIARGLVLELISKREQGKKDED